MKLLVIVTFSLVTVELVKVIQEIQLKWINTIVCTVLKQMTLHGL